eukprot:2354755-Prorocentrum_lima.AAC.2
MSLAKSPFWRGARIGLNAREEAQDVPQRPTASASMSRLRRVHARLHLSPCMLPDPKTCPSAP